MDNRFSIPRNWSRSAQISPRCSINDVGIKQKVPSAAAAAARVTTPKVVQIPVRFVGSKPRFSEPDSAVKIQKVFRGFLIRSRVKKIMELKVEADKIEDRMSRSVELIRKDGKERLRINEMLMSLLFKLDSICGVVDPGVRICRKSVIKKVISLQERLDSIAEVVDSAVESNENLLEVVDSAVESNENLLEVVDSAVESNENVQDNVSESKEVADLEISSAGFDLGIRDGDGENGEMEMKLDLGIEKAAEGGGENGQSVMKSYDVPFEDVIDSGMKAKPEEGTEIGENLNAMNTDNASFVSECMEEAMETQSAVNNNEKTVEMEEEEEENGGEKKRGEDEEMDNQQVLKRLMEDNQTMMSMMTQLFERNEMQTQMLNTLRNKVDLLEKAFVSDRMRKKKKRHCSS